MCKDKKDFAAHKPGAAATETKAQTCTVCSYVIKAATGHTHKYDTKWTTDNEGHWYACSGCNERKDFAEHAFDNACDADCNICSHTRTVSHIYKTEWSSDGEKHWHECSGCGEKADEAAHTPGAEATATTAQTCTACGYELTPATGTTPTEPGKTDGDGDNGDNTVVIVVACVVGVAAVGAGTALFVIKKKR